MFNNGSQSMLTRFKTKCTTKFITKLTTTCSLLTFIVCTSSSIAYAKKEEKIEKWYQVELILYSLNNTVEDFTESWPDTPNIVNVKNIVELITPELIPAPLDPEELESENSQEIGTNLNELNISEPVEVVLPFSTVDKTEYRLTVSANKLQNSPNYNLLLHIAWRQPVFSAKDKSAIYLHDGLNKLVAHPLFGNKNENTGSLDQLSEISELSMSDQFSNVSDDMDNETLARESLNREIRNRDQESMSIDELIAEEELRKSLDSAMNIELNTDPDSNIKPELNVENKFEDGLSLLSSGPDTQRFFGTFKLSLSRFLHIDIDMLFRGLLDRSFFDPATLQNDNSENTADEFQASINALDESSNFDVEEYSENLPINAPHDYRLLTTRRVKPDEIHFFDHPKFGMITMVTRYALPKPEDEEPVMQPFIP